jgi:hypothetical protein
MSVPYLMYQGVQALGQCPCCRCEFGHGQLYSSSTILLNPVGKTQIRVGRRGEGDSVVGSSSSL